MPSKRKPKRRAVTYTKYRDTSGRRMVADRSERGERNHADERPVSAVMRFEDADGVAFVPVRSIAMVFVPKEQG